MKDWHFAIAALAAIALIVFVVVLSTRLGERQEERFMRSCVKSKPEYECVMLWQKVCNDR